MKALKLDYKYFQYPEDHPTIDLFIEFVNENPLRFIPLVEYLQDNCVEPYFIKTDIAVRYVNMSKIEFVQEEEIIVFSQAEYDRRLALVIQDHCLDCVNYREEEFLENMLGHRDKINLDGKCIFKSTIDDSI